MRQLTLNEAAQITGARICSEIICVNVNTAGIPSSHVGIIEQNVQAANEGRITIEQAAVNIFTAGCQDSYQIWINRFEAMDFSVSLR